MSFNPEKYNDQTGGLFEWQFIGNAKTDSPEYKKELKRLQEEAAEKEGATGGFVSHKKSLELVQKSQPFDPANPYEKPFARDIRVSLIDLMIINGMITESEEDKDRIKFYTAVGTPLDKFHGVDAFLEFEDKDGKKYTVTFDLTLNPNKQKYKSDIIVAELPDPNLEEDKMRYLATIEQYAQKVLGVIKIKKSHEENNPRN